MWTWSACARQPQKSSSMGTSTARAVTTSHALRATLNGVVPTPNLKDGVAATPSIRRAAPGNSLQIFEQAQSLRQGVGLHGSAEGGVLQIQRGDRGGVIQALQRGDGCFELNLLTAGDRLLGGNGVQPCTDGRPDVRRLAERLIDIVDGVAQ